MGGKVLTGPCRSEVGAVGIARPAEQVLPRDRVLIGRTPLKVGPGNAVVGAPLDLTIGREKAHERTRDVAPHASDERGRFEVLLHEIGTERAGNDDASPAPIVRDEHGVGARSDLSRRAGAPPWRCDRSRRDRLDGGREKLDPLEEERPLLGKEQGEPLVGGDLRDIGLDLGEVGVERRIDRSLPVRRPLDVDARLRLRRPGLERASQLRGGVRELRGSRTGPRRCVPPGERPERPDSVFSLQMKQFRPRGSFAEKI